MHLSCITLRGFKSFAEKTVLPLEPGVTVIVGPNGSGKSNVVDALTWVLGTQSPKSLRGAAMADVIFAGAAGRPALGRASVEITIDNSDGAVPLDFTEITVGRAMFASGETEYTLNGKACRQLDIAELLNDTGLGRESHTIVSQGQLDAILTARPEDRRAFIDEAAGIIKHRRRKDRALRKLQQMAEHAERLADVVRELERNLRPLERQAEAAARHAELTAALRAVRIERATDDLVRCAARFARIDDLHRDRTRVAREANDRLEALRAEQSAAEAGLAQLQPAVERAVAAHFRLANTVERLRSVRAQIAERQRGLQTLVDQPVMLRDPTELRKAAAIDREGLEECARDVASLRGVLREATAEREEAERARRAHEQAAAAEARRRTTAREHRLRWEGQVAALRSTLARAASEQGRISGRLMGLRERQERHDQERRVARTGHAEQHARREECAAAAADADAVVDQRRARLDELLERERDCERRRAALAARGETLEAAAAEVTDGTGTLLDAGLDGIVGPLAEQVGVKPGYERAVSVALGAAADAVIARDVDTAERAARAARQRATGRVHLLVAGGEAVPGPEGLPTGVQPVAALLDGEVETVWSLSRLLAGAVVVDDYESACALARARPELIVVTTAGDVAGAAGYVAGSVPATTTVEQRAALLEARRHQAELTSEAQRLADEVRAARAACAEAEEARAAAVAELKAATIARDERAAHLRRLDAEAAAYRRELEAVAEALEQLEAEVATRSGELAALERDELPDHDVEIGPDLEAEQLDDALRAARDREVDARVALSSADSRRDEIARRIAAAEREAQDLEQAWVAADLRQRRRRVAVERCRELQALAEHALAAGETALIGSASDRQMIEGRRDERQQSLGVLRSRLADAERALAEHTRNEHAGELDVAEARHALDDARQRVRDLGLDPDAVPAGSGNEPEGGDLRLRVGGGEPEGWEPIDDDRRSELAEREEQLARQVALLGPVNPLAVDEFEALRERRRFLGAQLHDLERSRRDLLEMVAAVDDRIRQVFGEAFADVATAFERLFVRLFPGGEGRLVLTNPDDLLATGVDVEARPAGKRVKRLSLLSGGERSLVALAVAFAIFTARPSPFYVLDEVEAALDDVNLQRVLDVIGEFRATSQIIVITHQKRTMEIADVLYGVTMRSGGVSKVLSQRLSDVA